MTFPIMFWESHIIKSHMSIVLLISYTLYEGWNFNSGNYLFTTDTK